jgi:hypothetical protein
LATHAHAAGVLGRWSKWLVVLSLVLVTGGHWVLLQSAAWVGMTVSFAQEETVSVALEKTFSGENPCPVCKFVKAGKEAEKKHDSQKLETKLDFHWLAGTRGLFPPRPFRHFTIESQRVASSGQAPLLPPPRLA